MTGKRYGQGRWTQDLIASGVNIARLKSEAERGNEQAVSLVNEMDTYANTLPDTLVDWMTIAEQRNISGTKLEGARGQALASGWGKEQLPTPTGTEKTGGFLGIGSRKVPSYGEDITPLRELSRPTQKSIGAYRKYKGYPTIGEGKEKTTVPDLSGLAQGGTETTPTGDIRDKVREFLESKDIEPSEKNIDIFIGNNPQFE